MLHHRKLFTRIAGIFLMFSLSIVGSKNVSAEEMQHSRFIQLLEDNDIEVCANDTIEICKVRNENNEIVGQALHLVSEEGEQCSDTYLIEYEEENGIGIMPLYEKTGTQRTVTVTGYYNRITNGVQYYYKPYKVSAKNSGTTSIIVEYLVKGCRYTSALVDTNTTGYESIYYNIGRTVANRVYSKSGTLSYYYYFMGSGPLAPAHTIAITIGGNIYYVDMPMASFV